MTDNNNFYYDILLEYIKNQDIYDLVNSNLPFSIQNDYNIILDLVKYNGYLIHCASDRLRGNKEIVLTAIRNYGYDEDSALGYASEELRGDKEVVFTAVQEYGAALEYASEELRNDKEVVLTAVKKDSEAFQFASEELRNDKEVVTVAIEQDGYALKYTSLRLRADKEVVLVAVKQNGGALQYASEELRNDEEVVLAAIKQNGGALVYASEELRNDEEVVLTAIKQNGFVYNYIPEQFKNNKKVLFAAVKQNGLALIPIILYYGKHQRVINNKELLSIAVQQNIEALQYLQFVSKKIRKDKHFLIECYRINKNSIQFNDFIKEFDNLENGIYNDDIFMKKNADILNLINNNKKQLYEYLFENKKYEIIYENEEIAEYIKDNNKIAILSLNDIKPICDYNIEETKTEEVVEVTEEEIKKEYSKNLFKINPELTPIFIK